MQKGAKRNFFVQIPEPNEWKEREERQECPVCGTSKDLWRSKLRQKRGRFCSKKCYYIFYTTVGRKYWPQIRRDILKRDKKCQVCGAKRSLQVDHKIALVLGGNPVSEDNLWTLCKNCHKEKTRRDMFQMKIQKNSTLMEPF